MKQGSHPGMGRQSADGRNNPMMGAGGQLGAAHPPFVAGFGAAAIHDQMHPPYLAYGGNMLGEGNRISCVYL